MKNFWKIQQSADKPKTLELYIYGNIEGDYYDWWTGKTVKSETSATHIREAIAGYGAIDNIDIFINSLGGDCFEGNAIANMIRRCKAKTTAYIDAYACSAASVIACACDEVVMPRNTIMMIHNAWAKVSGNSAELRKAADDLEIQNGAFASIYLEKSGGKISASKLKELLDTETYLTAEMAYKYGLCDRIEQYDAKLTEPTDDDRQAAAQQRIDLERVCAMLHGTKPAPESDEPAKPEGGDDEKEAPAPEEAEPDDTTPKNSACDAFADKAADAILNKMKFFA